MSGPPWQFAQQFEGLSVLLAYAKPRFLFIFPGLLLRSLIQITIIWIYSKQDGFLNCGKT